MFINERLRTARKELGLSPMDVVREFAANRMIISYPTVISHENGRTRPTVDQLANYSMVLGKPVSYFFDSAV